MSDVADPLSSFAPADTSPTSQSHASRVKPRAPRNTPALAATGHGITTSVLFLVVFLPPIVMAVVSVWAAVTGLRSLWEGFQLLKTWQVGSIGTLLPSLDAASRLALFGVSFFAVLFGLIVFMGGTFGRGWRHLFLVPAVILIAPSLVIFVQSSRMTSAFLTQLGVPLPAQVLCFAYLVLDMLILSLMLTDARPRRHTVKARRRRVRSTAARVRRQRGSQPLRESASADLPYVRFDLSNPFDDTVTAEPVKAEGAGAKDVEAEPDDARSEVMAS